MARAPGSIAFNGGGGAAGWVGDLPIGDAIAAVREGRVHLESDRPCYAGDVEILLAGLEVASIRELRDLVLAGRDAEAVSERAAILAAAVGIARFHLYADDAEAAQRALDDASSRTRELLRGQMLDAGFEGPLVDVFLGGGAS